MALGSEFTSNSMAAFRFYDEIRKQFHFFLPTYDDDDAGEPYTQLIIFHVMAAIKWADEKYGLVQEGDYLLVNGISFLQYVTIPNPDVVAALEEICYDEYGDVSSMPKRLTEPFEIVVSPPEGYGEGFDLAILQGCDHWSEAGPGAHDAFVRSFYERIPSNILGKTIRVACMTMEETAEPFISDEWVFSVNKDGEPILLPDPLRSFKRKK